MGDVAGMGAELPTLSRIAHEMLATTDAGVLHLGIAVKQIPMRIPPDHTALVRAEAALPMPWAEHEPLAGQILELARDLFFGERFGRHNRNVLRDISARRLCPRTIAIDPRVHVKAGWDGILHISGHTGHGLFEADSDAFAHIAT